MLSNIELARICEHSESNSELFKNVWDACFQNNIEETRFSKLIAMEAWLEAAMLMVPEDWWWRLEHCGGLCKGGKDFYIARLFNADGQQSFAIATTPQNAVCAASLRARFPNP